MSCTVTESSLVPVVDDIDCTRNDTDAILASSNGECLASVRFAIGKQQSQSTEPREQPVSAL
jgi:hypothetical protein